MHSYETLVVLALALSTASPALSAPVRENQHQARADVEIPSGVSTDIGSILKSVGKTVGINGLLGAGLATADHFFQGGNSTRRDLPADLRFDGLSLGPPNSDNGDDSDTTSTTPATIRVGGFPVTLNHREPGVGGSFLDDLASSSILKNIGTGVLGGAAGALGTFGASELFNHSRREPSPISLSASGLAKSGAGLLASLLASEGAKDLLNLTSREPGPSPATSTKLANGALDLEEFLQATILRRLAELD